MYGYYSFFRAEELETALMEMVKQDNRRQLSARVYLDDHYCCSLYHKSLPISVVDPLTTKMLQKTCS